MEVKPKAYKETAAHYAEKYGKSSDTIRRWQRRAAPLDQPEKMAAWIAVSIAPNAGVKGLPTFEGEENQGELDEDEPEATDIETGARAEIEELSKTAAKLRRRYNANANNPALGPALLKQWTDVCQVLRQMMKDTPKSERDDGKSVPIADVTESITRALVNLRKEIETIPQAIAMAISHLKTDIILEVETEAKHVIDEVIASMEKAKFIA